jgi:hypothetical protein
VAILADQRHPIPVIEGEDQHGWSLARDGVDRLRITVFEDLDGCPPRR